MATDGQRVVIVLGFHRSGTSMVTRILNLLGVDLGAEDALLPPDDRDNERGYWEPRWMIELNEQVLTAVGAGTFEPFWLQPGWERSAALDPLRERARALLDEHYADRGLWGWKDPRTSLTLPFWRELIAAPLRCVVCVRSPADAVASLLKRNIGIDRWTYAERWLDYTGLALAATTPEERALVFYEDALRDPAGEARRLAAFAGLAEPSDETVARVAESVDPDLRHHRTSAWDVAVDPGLPVEARALYVQLRAARRLEDADGAGNPERLEEALARAGVALRDARRQTLEDAGGRRLAEARATELEAEVQRLAAQLEATRQQADDVARERDRLAADAERLAATLQERDAALTAIIGSRSWRLTGPLRAAGRRMWRR